MKPIFAFAVCLLLPLFAFGAGTARVRVVNESRAPVTVSGTTVPRGGSAVVEVPAGAPGEILGEAYPALRSGATYTLRVKGEGRGAGVRPAVTPPASAPRPAPTTTTTRPAPRPAPTTTTTRPAPRPAPTTTTTRPAPRPAPTTTTTRPAPRPAPTTTTTRPAPRRPVPTTTRPPQPQAATVRHPFPKPYVTHCPERVRVVVGSRTLGSGDSALAGAAEYAVSAAHHEHVFVYDAATGELVDDLGWTYEDGGKAFQDRANEARYDMSGRTVEIPGNVYFDVRNAYEAVADRFGYRLVNDMSWPEAVASAGASVAGVVTPHLKCATKLPAVRQKDAVAEFLLCNLFAYFEGRESSGRIERRDDFRRPREDSATGRLLVNCQLWASFYLEALEEAAVRFAAPAASPPSAPAARAPSESKKTDGFRLRRVSSDKADLLVWVEEGDATQSPVAWGSFGHLKLQLLNRTGRHLALCVVRVGFSAGYGQDVVFTDVPPGESRPAQEDYALVGESAAACVTSDAFVFPAVILAVEGNRPVDLYEADEIPSVGYLPLRKQ